MILDLNLNLNSMNPVLNQYLLPAETIRITPPAASNVDHVPAASWNDIVYIITTGYQNYYTIFIISAGDN